MASIISRYHEIQPTYDKYSLDDLAKDYSQEHRTISGFPQEDFKKVGNSQLYLYDVEKLRELDEYLEGKKKELTRGNRCYHKKEYIPTMKFKLTDNGVKELMKSNIFVNRENQFNNFLEFYFKQYSDHMPIYITADSILHPWHKSFDKILESIEMDILGSLLYDIINGIMKETKDVTNPLAQDVYKYFEIAFQLSKESYLHPTTNIGNSITLFDNPFYLDPTQFQPRGHYNKNEKLKKYFKTMQWFNLAKLKISSNKIESMKGILYITLLMQKYTNHWITIEQLIKLFIGIPNNLNCQHIKIILDKFNLANLNEIENANYSDIFTFIQTSPELFPKNYINTNVEEGYDFSLFSQSFTIDNFIIQELVHNHIKVNDDIIPRTMTSSLDIAFALFQNNETTHTIIDRISGRNKDFVQGRDKLPYQKNLVSLRETISELPAEYWHDTIYNMWIYLLQSLSQTNDMMPDITKTETYRHLMINTQLASWTELRHDTILYVEPVTRFMLCCGFKDFYVEPNIEFWNRFIQLMDIVIDKLKLSSIKMQDYWEGNKSYHLDQLFGKYTNFFKSFRETLITLREIVQLQESTDVNKDPKYITFINKIISNTTVFGSGGPPSTEWDGWYPSLYYGFDYMASENEMFKFNPEITDIYTSPRDLLDDYGRILYEGTGYVNPMYIIINNNLYCGPLYTHHELITEYSHRMTDEKWAEKLGIH